MTIKEIMQETDLTSLFETQLDINSDLGILHQKKNDANYDYPEVIGKMKVLYSELEAVKHRIDEIKQTAQANRNEQNRINYNFSRIAKQILTKQTYEKIRGMAANSLKEMKPYFSELRENKVSE